jgi:hypothetical protein
LEDVMPIDDYDRLGEAGRDRDRARRQEADLPLTGPEAPRHPSPTPADLDAFMGKPTEAAASVRRVRGPYARR